MWLTGLVALRHVGSSRTRAQIRVPCTCRRILNHCATREVPGRHFLSLEALWVPEVASVAGWTPSVPDTSSDCLIFAVVSSWTSQFCFSPAIELHYRAFEFEVGILGHREGSLPIPQSHTHTQPSCTNSVWCDLCVPLRPL